MVELEAGVIVAGLKFPAAIPTGNVKAEFKSSFIKCPEMLLPVLTIRLLL